MACLCDDASGGFIGKAQVHTLGFRADGGEKFFGGMEKAHHQGTPAAGRVVAGVGEPHDAGPAGIPGAGQRA